MAKSKSGSNSDSGSGSGSGSSSSGRSSSGSSSSPASRSASSASSDGPSDSGDSGLSSSSGFEAFSDTYSIGFSSSRRKKANDWSHKKVQRIVATLLNSDSPQKIHIVRVRHLNNVVRYFFFKMISGGKRKHLETASNLLRTVLLSSIGGDVERASKAVVKGNRHIQNANADHGAMWRELVIENHSGNLNVVENSALMHVAGPANKIRCYGYLDQYINTPSNFSITVRPSDDEPFFRFFLELVDRPEGTEDETPGAAEFVGSYSIDSDSVTYNSGKTREIVEYPDPGFIDKSLKKLRGWRSDIDEFLDGNQGSSS